MASGAYQRSFNTQASHATSDAWRPQSESSLALLRQRPGGRRREAGAIRWCRRRCRIVHYLPSSLVRQRPCGRRRATAHSY